jgi:hypothetical protein
MTGEMDGRSFSLGARSSRLPASSSEAVETPAFPGERWEEDESLASLPERVLMKRAERRTWVSNVFERLG